jgi:DNA-directed RNA polymerase specialized sigma subunit
MSTEYINNQSFETIITNFQKYKREKCKYEMILEDVVSSHERKKVRQANPEDTKLMKYTGEHKIVVKNFKGHQEQLAFAFYTLSENIVRYAKFNIDPDDAIQEGVLICFEKIDRFDPSKGKAFNYMTTCILNHFRQLYRSLRNYNELKKKYYNHIQEVFDQSYGGRGGKERVRSLDRDLGNDII